MSLYHRLLLKQIPELEQLDLHARNSAIEHARHDTYHRSPGKGVAIIIGSLAGAMIAPIGLYLIAPEWVTGSMFNTLVVLSVPVILAPLLSCWLQARAIAPTLRASIQIHDRGAAWGDSD